MTPTNKDKKWEWLYWLGLVASGTYIAFNAYWLVALLLMYICAKELGLIGVKEESK